MVSSSSGLPSNRTASPSFLSELTVPWYGTSCLPRPVASSYHTVMRLPGTSAAALPLSSTSGACFKRAAALPRAIGALGWSGVSRALFAAVTSSAAAGSSVYFRLCVAARFNSSRSSCTSAGLSANCTAAHVSLSRFALADGWAAAPPDSTFDRVRILRMAAARICENCPSKRPSSVRLRLSSNSFRKRSRNNSSSFLSSSSALFLSRSNSSLATRTRTSHTAMASALCRRRISSNLRASSL
mmetsp:Transcript_12205/g.30722  ORF Transcript_12205/g.30722 Transcript_12205/m.30722 type:complete len:242 (+) Transcript_12205:319-1044(+)